MKPKIRVLESRRYGRGALVVIAQGLGRFGLIDRRVLIWRREGPGWWLSYEGRHPDWTPRPPA